MCLLGWVVWVCAWGYEGGWSGGMGSTGELRVVSQEKILRGTSGRASLCEVPEIGEPERDNQKEDSLIG